MDILGGALSAMLIIVIWQWATTRTRPGRAAASASFVVIGSVMGAGLAAALYALGLERSVIAWAFIALLVALAGQALMRWLLARRSGLN